MDPVASLDEAVAALHSIATLLPETDGLACFNRMYLVVSEAVRGHVGDGSFADPAFMGALDLVFVNRYLSAVRAYRTSPSSAPRAWRVLLDGRADPGVAPLQFALTGMNAHINLDLAPALVQTCQEHGTTPDQGSHHADFEKVNQTLDALDQQIRESFEQGALLELDRQFAGLENLAAGFSITAAREAAWVNAEVLWKLGGDDLLARSYLATLDRTVGFAGRALLTRLPAERTQRWVTSGRLPETRGVTVELLATVDLGAEIEGLEGRELRMRLVTIEPGGVFGPVHDHRGRPGLVYVLQGAITDHRDGVSTDYGPGLGWPEDHETLHWLENRGAVPAVEVSVDVLSRD